jgi:hypothetical protein
MLRGATPRAEEIVGTAVLRMVVSRDSIKNATATSHGRSRLEAGDRPDEDGPDEDRPDEDEGGINGLAGFIARKLREASLPRTC